VKPAVSGGAYKTRRVRSGQSELDGLVADGDTLVQPYVPELSAPNETSLVYVDGSFTHAVTRKSAMEHGIDAADEGRAHHAAKDELALAERVLATLPATLLYARVDMVRSARFGLILLE